MIPDIHAHENLGICVDIDYSLENFSREWVELWIEKYSLPPPTGLLRSRKLQYLAGVTQQAAPQNKMLDIQRIQFISRCRLSCHFEFSGDFGSGDLCACGEADTLAHIRRGCIWYKDLLPTDNMDYFSVEKSEALYKKIIERHRELTKDSTC